MNIAKHIILIKTMNKFLYFCIFHIYLTLPVQKATHVVKLSLSVDGISKGFLQLALFQ